MRAGAKAAVRLAVAVAAAVLAASVVEAIDLGANGRVYTGTQDSNGTDIQQGEEQIVVTLGQPITRWFGVSLTYRYNHFMNELDNGQGTERKSTQPQLVLSYSRPKFSGQLTFMNRENSGTFETDNLDVNAILGEFHLRPDRGPRYSLRFRDDSNVADAGVFGRDTDSTAVEFDLVFNRSNWTAAYAYRWLSLDNNLSGLELDQNSHEIRANYSDRFLGDRLGFGFDSRVSQVSEDGKIPSGIDLAEPVPAQEGLFAVDTSPAIGTLDPSPGLIDGDTNSPVLPPIQIGGAATFRNIGLDVAFTRPVSRLEVWVDAPSDPTLVWEVWHSPDNLVWSIVPGVVPEYDGARFAYTLQFPVTTDRFFKAVNVSVNAFGDVNVTECRALVDVDPTRPDDDTRITNFRLNATASYIFSPRLTANATVGYRSDENIATGFVGSDREDWSGVAAVRYAITPTLSTTGGYRFSEIRQSATLALERRQDELHGRLEWTPVPSVAGVFGVSHRRERAGSESLNTTDSVNVKAGTQLFPDLWLNSEVVFNRIDDPFSGFRQTSWTWREALESRPTRNWTLSGGLSQTWFDSVGRSTLTRQLLVQLRSSWNPVPFLTLIGDWNFGDDDNQSSLGQRYTVGWHPGTKLSGLVSYYAFESPGVNKTSTSTATLSYELIRNLDLFTTFSRTVFEQTGLETSRLTNFRVGLDFIF